MPESGKRKMGDRSSDRSSKRRKGGNKYRNSMGGSGNRTSIESGDSGVFVTCDMGKETRCIAEALDLFSQRIERVQDEHNVVEEADDAGDDDIEAQIRKEVEGLQSKSSTPRVLQAVRLDIPCLNFIRIDRSIDPVKLVHDLCVEAHAHPEQQKARFLKRMTPVTLVRKTLSVDLSGFASGILQPHFHAGGGPKKYAIRPNVRNNGKLNRDIIIKSVADAVGAEHSVDLQNYDLVIVVEVFQNVIGMSVVGHDYDELKRFNLSEIYRPTPKPQVAEQGQS